MNDQLQLGSYCSFILLVLSSVGLIHVEIPPNPGRLQLLGGGGGGSGISCRSSPHESKVPIAQPKSQTRMVSSRGPYYKTTPPNSG